MLQVLYRIPITQDGIPIYGFGMMLFVAFLACTWLAGRRAEREGISKEIIQDIAVWLFLGGLLGARITYLLNDNPRDIFNVWKLIRIWEGGIVLYGSILGGTAAYFLAWALVYRKRGLRTLPFLDAIAPSIALGLALGRMGCFLNGCCYGQVACADCAVVVPAHFPLSAPCREVLVDSGAQTVAGFTVVPDPGHAGVRVGAVSPGSAAYAAGLRPDHVIVGVNGQPIHDARDLTLQLGSLSNWPRGRSDLTLDFRRAPSEEPVSVTIAPRTLGLYPTQIYETVSMVLLMLVLLAYYPFRYHPGQVCSVLMVGYGIHRFLNEILRDDPRPKGLETYGSIFLIAFGAVMWLALLWWSKSHPVPVAVLPASPGASAEPTATEPVPPPAPAKDPVG